MPVLRIHEFSGVVPVRGDRALPDGFATKSMNTWLYGSELRGMRPPEDLIAVNAGTRRVMRIPRRTSGGDPNFPGTIPPPSYLGDSVWVQFADHDTDILKGQLVEDSYERWYFCSPTTGPMYNTYANLAAGSGGPYKLGVPGPAINTSGTNLDTPTISSITGGTAATNSSCAYLYTWVNQFGEESAPSLPVLGSGKNDAIWTIANIKDPPAASGYAAYSKKRLYRTITGASGGTTYYRVAEIALGTLTYADDRNVTTGLTDAKLANNLMLESVSWQPPPVTLKGWVAMPNGFLIGFDGSSIYFSEAYHWHAWPPEYKQATETPIVGLGVIGQTCVVCTQGYPSTVTGVKPASCAFTKVTTGEPCLSRGSIVSTPDGVIYASQNGLMMAGGGGIQNITEQLITREEWIREYAPQFLRAVRYQNGYLAMRMPPTGTRSGFFLDPTALKVALTEFTDFENIVNLNVDFWSGEVFPLKIGMVQHWDPALVYPTLALNNALMPVQWVSKEFQYPFKENFAAYAIYWDDARFSNVNYGTSIMPTTEHVRFRAYANRIKVYDQIVPFNGRGVRLPSGFKSDIWQFEICARAPIYSLHVASTMKELKGA